MKKVSIGITCYNQENFIRETLDSCLNQTYKNIEICIADDCSTDNTYDIILEYQKKYPNIIKSLRQKENRGKYCLCLNTKDMLKLCTGDYIARLDGDDIMLPERIEKQVNFLEKNKEYIGVYGLVEAFDTKTGKTISILGTSKYKITTKNLILHGNFIPSCIMYKNIKNLSCDPRLKIIGDWLFYIKLSILGNIGFIDDIMNKYRRHDNNVKESNKTLADLLNTLEIVKNNYPQYGKYINKGKSRIYNNRAHYHLKNNEYGLLIYYISKGFFIAPIHFIGRLYKFIRK